MATLTYYVILCVRDMFVVVVMYFIHIYLFSPGTFTLMSILNSRNSVETRLLKKCESEDKAVP